LNFGNRREVDLAPASAWHAYRDDPIICKTEVALTTKCKQMFALAVISAGGVTAG